LHGLPGSQNGEMHSGLTVEHSQFDTEWNKQKAIEAVEIMAKYVSAKNSRLQSLYGIQVISEPNHHQPNTDPHDFLDDYYDQAIMGARNNGIPYEIPIIVFEWTYFFDQWEDDRFSYAQYGNVIWDTHIYHTNMESTDEGVVITNPSLEDHQKRYWYDLCQIESFHKRQSGGVIVGEWSLAGPTWTLEKNQLFAKWITREFRQKSHGSLFWTWESDIAEWSFQKSETTFEMDWKSIGEYAKAADLVAPTTPDLSRDLLHVSLPLLE